MPGICFAAGLLACGGGDSAVPPAPIAQPPVIGTQPISQNVVVPGTASFAVVAAAAQTYQWRRDGAAIAGATLSNYTMLAASLPKVLAVSRV